MKQRAKKENKRQKAELGLAAASIIAGIISAAAGIGSAAINSSTQKKLAEEQNKKRLLAENEANAMQLAANQTQAMNYDQNNEIETLKTGRLNTLNSETSQFKCGGRKRMKKGGNTVTSYLNNINKYI